jgi:O-antigen/teichoic acid export membrane protein
MKVPASLRRRSLRAGAWVGGGHVVGQVMRLVGNLLLARLLMPEAFGLMAVVSTLMLALNLLSDIGSGTIIVQSPRGAEKEFLNTAWTLQVMRGVGIWAVAALAGLGILFGQSQHWFIAGTVYADPRLPALLVAATFAMVIDGFGTVNGKLAERNLEMHRISVMDIGARFVALAVMVVGAYLTGSIWSLVAGNLVSSVLRCVVGHQFLSGPRARFRLEPQAMNELLHKGKWVIVSSGLGFVAINGDRMLLGGLIDTTTLGLYSIALGLTGIASGAILAVLGRVLLPVFSEVVNKRRHQLGEVYRKFQQLADLCIGGISAFMFIASDLIIHTLYDSRYQAAGPIFAMLAIGAIGSRFLVVEQIYMAIGRTALMPAATLPRVIVLLLGIPIGYQIAQLNGAMFAIVLSSFVNWPLAIWFRTKNGLNDIRNDFVLPLAIGAGLSLGYAAVWVATQLKA